MNRQDLPEAMEPKHIQRFLDIGRRQTYELLADAPFRVVKVGRNYKISKQVFLTWFDGTDKEHEEQGA